MAFNNDASFNSDSGVGINDVRANENHDAAYWESYKVSRIILSIFLVKCLLGVCAQASCNLTHHIYTHILTLTHLTQDPALAGGNIDRNGGPEQNKPGCCEQGGCCNNTPLRDIYDSDRRLIRINLAVQNCRCCGCFNSGLIVSGLEPLGKETKRR